MSKLIEINANELKIVQSILTTHLKKPTTVWAFGSRARHKAKKYSDLDLLIDMGERIPLDIMASLAYDFEEASLPYKVDLVDFSAINSEFREKIDDEKTVIWENKCST